MYMYTNPVLKAGHPGVPSYYMFVCLGYGWVGYFIFLFFLINPRRACAARVTVVVLCVCVCTTILGLQATRRLMSNTNSFSTCYKGEKNNVVILLKRLRSRDMV